MIDMKNDLHRANDKFASIITDTNSINSKLRELSSRIDTIEEKSSQVINEKIEVALARLVESAGLNGNRELTEHTNIQIRESIAKNVPKAMKY